MPHTTRLGCPVIWLWLTWLARLDSKLQCQFTSSSGSYHAQHSMSPGNARAPPRCLVQHLALLAGGQIIRGLARKGMALPADRGTAAYEYQVTIRGVGWMGRGSSDLTWAKSKHS